MRRNVVFLAVAALAAVFVAGVWAQAPGKAGHGFEGYWMGVDPLDGGDSRRSLRQLDDGRLALAGRDTVLTLCDGTDRGYVSFDDGQLVGRNVLRSNALTIECFNNGATVLLRVRYELIEKGLMVEHTTRQDGTPVSTIVFHEVSAD